MKSISNILSWIGSQIYSNWKLLIVGLTGIPSGVIFIWYSNYFSSGSFSRYWWIIPLSSLIWVFFRFFLRNPHFLYASILYYLSNITYSIYTKGSVSEVGDFFYLTSLLFVTMSITEKFLFSQYATKLVVTSLFALLFAYEILPAIVPQFNMSYPHVFIMLLLMVLVVSSGMVIISELIILGIQELFGKTH